MEIVEVLKETERGRKANQLRGHSSKDVGRLTKNVVSAWKDMVDEWVSSLTEGSSGSNKKNAEAERRLKIIPAQKAPTKPSQLPAHFPRTPQIIGSELNTKNHERRLTQSESVDAASIISSEIHSPSRLTSLWTSLQYTSSDDSGSGWQSQGSSIVLEGKQDQENEGFVSPPDAGDVVDSLLDAEMILLPGFLDEGKILRFPTGEAPEYLEIDSFSSLLSFLKTNSVATAVKQLKISECPDPLSSLMVCTSLEYLEFSYCSFQSFATQDCFPTTLKKLKISNCIISELLLGNLMEQNVLSLESLEIDGCSSLESFSIDKLPATLRQLKIVNCINLKFLDRSLKIENGCPSLVGDASLLNMTSSSTLQLRELKISDCVELQFLPEGMCNFTHLNLLSISNCSSLESFPQGGLPNTCLTSLLISECEILKSLPQLHKIKSLETLSVCACPGLMSFPVGGLPPNLVSLCIIDCENLISLSHWELHKLKHLRKYSFVGGRPDLGDQ